MIYLVYAIHIITCIFLILVVLLQQGKGADLSVFGGGTTQAAFGARGAATLLHKLTVGFFVLFMVTTVSIGILQRSRRASSVMQGVEAPAVELPAATAPIPPTAPESSAPPEGSTAPAPQTESLEVPPAAPADGTEATSPPAASEAPAEPASGDPEPQANN